jgi:hypothetical protein
VTGQLLNLVCLVLLNPESAEADMLAGEASDEMHDQGGAVDQFRASFSWVDQDTPLWFLRFQLRDPCVAAITGLPSKDHIGRILFPQFWPLAKLNRVSAGRTEKCPRGRNGVTPGSRPILRWRELDHVASRRPSSAHNHLRRDSPLPDPVCCPPVNPGVN